MFFTYSVVNEISFAKTQQQNKKNFNSKIFPITEDCGFAIGDL